MLILRVIIQWIHKSLSQYNIEGGVTKMSHPLNVSPNPSLLILD